MKRPLLAGLAVLVLALARPGARGGRASAQQSDAYGSLVGMAVSASSDKGPEAGEIKPDAAHREKGAADAPSGDAPKTVYGSAFVQKSERTSPSPGDNRPPAKDEKEAPAVAAPASSAAAPRIWTRLFSSLLPPMTRIPAFEVAASTAPRRVRRSLERPVTTASAAGSAQGLLEIVSASNAPYGAEETMRDAVAEKPAPAAP